MKLELIVANELAGQTALDVLRTELGISGLLAKKIRLYGELLCNGKHHRMVDAVQAKDKLEAFYQNEAEPAFPQNEKLEIIYQDEWLLALNKPADMVTHPSALHLNDSVLSYFPKHQLHPIIRLDKDTSGVLLLGRNGYAHDRVAKAKMDKYYLGLVHGRFKEKKGIISAPIRRSSTSIILRVVAPDGKEAKTCYQELRYYPEAHVSLVRFKLLTGRTHQIRVHCLHVGQPLVGDTLYGLADLPEDQSLRKSQRAWLIQQLMPRQALHAYALQIKHPLTQETLNFMAGLPLDFKQVLRWASFYKNFRGC